MDEQKYSNVGACDKRLRRGCKATLLVASPLTTANRNCRGRLGSKLAVFTEIHLQSDHRTAEVVGSNPIISTRFN